MPGTRPIRTDEPPLLLDGGRFRRADLISEDGGMGIVYGGIDAAFDPPREVAIKFLRDFPAAKRRRARERFRYEIQIASRLNIQGLVPVYHAGEEQDWPYYVMPRLDRPESIVEYAITNDLG